MENIPQILYAIADLHIHSETAGSLHPALLDHIGTFTGTLHKIHTFVDAQQDGSKIKYFFRQSEMSTLLKECRCGLDQALEIFKINIGTINFQTINEMKQKTDNMHNELLELISTFSDGTLSDTSSSVYQNANDSHNSSNSFSMLPSVPKIFHGRESELKHIIETLSQDSPRVAILGGGGMGKTSLARAALHHPDIATKFEKRYFVSAESATTSIELAALIGLHLGLQPGKDLTKPVVQYFLRKPPSLLILDNLETPWEPINSCGRVEEFLSLLTDVPHLALILLILKQITMRGAERPAKVAWTHPFLLPLKTLSDDAARQTFIDITDISHNNKDMEQLLQFTDNMPLAVDLMAHLADYEGFANVLARWKTEKTSLLSAGNDRKSNLDVSIQLSLSSPRITSGAKELLSLLSILPDGLSDVELVQSKLPIKDIRSCKTALVATSLAYIDNKKRFRALMPIREHIQQFSPISELLDLGLHPHDPDLTDTTECILNLNSVYRVTGRSFTPLMDNIPAILSQYSDRRLEVQFITEVLLSAEHRPISNPESVIVQGISHCENFDDPVLEGDFYQAAGYYNYYLANNLHNAMRYLEKALKLTKSCGNTNHQCSVLTQIAELKWSMGNAGTAQIHVNKARRLAILSGNLYQEAWALQMAAACTTQLGDFRNSILHLHRAKEILGICGITGGRLDSSIETAKAELHLLKSEYTDARSIHTQIAQNMDGDPFEYAWALLNIALIDVITGATEEAVQKNLNDAKTLFSTMKSVVGVTCCEMISADLQLREGDISQAKDMLQDCFNLCWGKHADNMSFCLERFADRNRWHVKECGSPWPVVYLAYGHQSKEKLAVHKALLFLGDVFITKGDDDTAKSLFMVALEGFVYMDVHRSRGQCLLRLGDLANKKGDLLHATKLWMAALPLFEMSSQAKDVVQINDRLTELENNGKALAHLATLHPPGTIFEELSLGIEKSNIEGQGAAGQKSPEGMMLSDM
ncbi:hypothetical protein B0H13DRAFT_1850578 [Mycena leptocephala]|nr:hypothetical protein B0H13DRAFT_1850578 [Mycena leptocephala]